MSAELPAREFADIVELAGSIVVMGTPDEAFARLPESIVHLPLGREPPPEFTDDDLPDAISPAWKAPTSGGSGGLPKLIVSGDPALLDTSATPPFGIAPGGCMLVSGRPTTTIRRCGRVRRCCRATTPSRSRISFRR